MFQECLAPLECVHPIEERINFSANDGFNVRTTLPLVADIMRWLDVGLAEYEMGCFRPGDDMVENRFRSNDPPTTDTT